MQPPPLLDRLRPGDHLCWSFREDTAFETLCAGYVSGAARDGDRVLVVTDSRTPDQVVGTLDRAGVGASRLVDDGVLVVRTTDEHYLPDGAFDPSRTTRRWRDDIGAAARDGHRGLRVLADMRWTSRTPAAGLPALVQYEAELNSVFAEGFARVICAYDGRRLDRNGFARISQAHPATMPRDADVADRADWWSPLLRAAWLDVDRRRLALAGECDLSNREALRALLDGLTDPETGGADPVLDVHDLTFVDVDSAAVIVAVAARLGRLRVVGARGPVLRVLAFAGARRAPGLVFVDREEAAASRADR